MSAGTTRVNGIGLWNSWTRNFKTPLLACLDLLDNSFDAALPSKTPSNGNQEDKKHSNGISNTPIETDKVQEIQNEFEFKGKFVYQQ